VMSSREIPRELSSIDVVMCSHNSSKSWFRRCLESIRREIPVHCFILVDCFSTDDTLGVVREYFSNVKLVSTDAKLGPAREMGIQLVDRPWFVFVDDDIELSEGWYSRIVSYVEDGVGAVIGSPIETSPAFEKYSRLIMNDKNAMRFMVIDKNSPETVRGLTCDTLCRKEAVRDWVPPADLAAYEDYHVLRHIVRRGFRWISTSDATCRHYGLFSLRFVYRKAKWNGAGARLIGATTLQRLIRRTSFIGRKGLWGSLRIRNPQLMLLFFAEHFGMIVGYLKWSRYTSSYINVRK
jgi:glycosyltransferase involved in cell wall biosynthesis